MKNVGDLMKRLQKMMPAHVEPAFKTGEELLAWQKEQGKLRSEELERENSQLKEQQQGWQERLQALLGRMEEV